MKICIATDFHLSYRQYGLEERENDFNIQFKKMVKDIIEENPDILLILGDIFNTPYPKPISMKIYNDGISKIADNGIKCYGIIGNHTDLQRKNYYQVDNLFEKVQLIGDDCIAFEDVFICGVNYRPRTHDIKGIIDKLYEKGKDYRVKIILLHQALKKDQNIGYDFDEAELELGRFDYVFLGHLHKKITRYDEETDTIYHYPGSLNSCNVVELSDEMRFGRGYSIFDTDTLMLLMRNIESNRKYVQYNLMEDDLNDEFIDEAIESLSKYSVKPLVQVNVIGNDVQHIYELCNKLEDYSLSLKYKITRKEDVGYQSAENEKLTFGDNVIKDMLKKRFDEEWVGDFAYDLYELLSKGDIESSMELADFVYEKHFKKQ